MADGQIGRSCGSRVKGARRLAHFLALGLGSGRLPYAPGTAGTLVAVPLYLVLQGWPLPWYVGVLLAMFALGVVVCGVAARDLGAKDPSVVVWDEIVGYLVTMVGAPPGWLWVALGFVLFRAFDIVKPWPVGLADRRLAGGLGIMLDDVLAGAWAGAVLYTAARLAGV